MNQAEYEVEIAAIRQFLMQSAGVTRQGAIDGNTRLLDSGYLDSLGVVQMMVFLGETMQIEVGDEDFTPENFETVGSLARFVASKQARAAA